MTKAEKLHTAQDFITWELQKKATDRVDALSWKQTPQDRATKFHRLVIFRGGKKSTFTFTEYELLEDYGSKQWEKQLRGHINDMMIEF